MKIILKNILTLYVNALVFVKTKRTLQNIYAIANYNIKLNIQTDII